MKIKTAKFSLIGFTLAVMLTANFAVAQTPATTTSGGASVTSADLQAMKNLSSDIRRTKNKIGGWWITGGTTQQDYLDIRQKGLEMCADIGNRLYVITGSKPGTSITTAWAEAVNSCNFATYIAKGTPTDFLGIQLKRDFIIREDIPGNSPGGILYNQISNNKTKALTQTEYEAAQKTALASVNPLAGTAVAALDNITNVILTTITSVLTSAVLSLTALGGMLIDFANNQTANALLPDIVGKGWTIIRDLMNMVFILALIIISIATILRRPENYNVRKTILNLILMALLINFSKVIAETLISASDAVANIFLSVSNLNSYGQLFSGLVTQGAGAGGFFYTNGAYGSGSAAAQGIAKILLAMFITAGYLGIAALIVVRLIGLWILTIFSPIAFAMNILPYTKNYAQQWWGTFIKYLVWSPVIMFFLYLINLIIVRKGSGYIIGSVADYILIGALMVAANIFTRKTGMYGTDAILNYAKQGSHMASRYLLRGTPVRHAGVALEKVGLAKVGKGIQKVGTTIEKGTARIEGLPNTISAPLKRSEAARQKLVSTQSRMDQIRLGTLPVDKDTASSLSFEELQLIHKKGKLDEKTIGTLYEHGGGGQRNSLLALHNAGLITDTNAQDAIRAGEWDKIGGKGQPLPSDYLIARDPQNNQLLDVTLRNPGADLKDQKIKAINLRYRQNRRQRRDQGAGVAATVAAAAAGGAMGAAGGGNPPPGGQNPPPPRGGGTPRPPRPPRGPRGGGGNPPGGQGPQNPPPTPPNPGGNPRPPRAAPQAPIGGGAAANPSALGNPNNPKPVGGGATPAAQANNFRQGLANPINPTAAFDSREDEQRAAEKLGQAASALTGSAIVVEKNVEKSTQNITAATENLTENLDQLKQVVRNLKDNYKNQRPNQINPPAIAVNGLGSVYPDEDKMLRRINELRTIYENQLKQGLTRGRAVRHLFDSVLTTQEKQSLIKAEEDDFTRQNSDPNFKVTMKMSPESYLPDLFESISK
jgi:hypothetical protein